MTSTNASRPLSSRLLSWLGAPSYADGSWSSDAATSYSEASEDGVMLDEARVRPCQPVSETRDTLPAENPRERTPIGAVACYSLALSVC